MSSDNNSTLSAQVKKLNVSDDTSRTLIVEVSNVPSEINGLTQSQASETAPSELVAEVDDLLNQLSSKFGNLSSELIGKSSLESRTMYVLSSRLI
ncbi:hypothetical protein LTR17_007579 [Elasticomyces elasticus]|nr:hypothetical protein LTR17_007579 [Elasticomyces elasticus]